MNGLVLYIVMFSFPAEKILLFNRSALSTAHLYFIYEKCSMSFMKYGNYKTLLTVKEGRRVASSEMMLLELAKSFHCFITATTEV